MSSLTHVRYELCSSVQDAQLHIQLFAQFDDKKYELAHWVASHKDQLVREYLCAMGWTPPAERRKPAEHTDTCMCNDCTPEAKPEVAK